MRAWTDAGAGMATGLVPLRKNATRRPNEANRLDAPGRVDLSALRKDVP